MKPNRPPTPTSHFCLSNNAALRAQFKPRSSDAGAGMTAVLAIPANAPQRAASASLGEGNNSAERSPIMLEESIGPSFKKWLLRVYVATVAAIIVREEGAKSTTFFNILVDMTAPPRLTIPPIGWLSLLSMGVASVDRGRGVTVFVNLDRKSLLLVSTFLVLGVHALLPGIATSATTADIINVNRLIVSNV